MRAYLWRMFAGSLGLTVAAELGVAILYLSVERLREGAGQTKAGARPGLRGAFSSEGMGHGARTLLLTARLTLFQLENFTSQSCQMMSTQFQWAESV